MTTKKVLRKEPQTESGITWFEVHFPHDWSAGDVVTALQPLAYRPLLGWRRRTPIVVFELRAKAATIRWLVGIDQRISGVLPGQLRAQLPGLVLVPLRTSRAVPSFVADIRP